MGRFARIILGVFGRRRYFVKAVDGSITEGFDPLSGQRSLKRITTNVVDVNKDEQSWADRSVGTRPI